MICVDVGRHTGVAGQAMKSKSVSDNIGVCSGRSDARWKAPVILVLLSGAFSAAEDAPLATGICRR